MHRKPIIGILILVALAMGLPASALVLVEDGQPASAIVLPAQPNSNLQSAANLLQRIIERSSGARLPIVEGEAVEGATIEVGGTPASLEVCREASGLKLDGVIVRVAGDKLIITAQSTYAVRIAAVRFLEEALEVRWLFPGELGEIVPRSRSMEVPDDFDLLEEPDLESRMFSGMFGADPALWRLHLSLQFHHNLYRIVPVEKHGQTHPEYFPMIDGERRIPTSPNSGWQPETTNPEVVQLAIDAADKWFTDNPEEVSFSLGVTDSGGESYSPEAVALDEELGPPTPTNRFYHFYNQVAEGLEAKWPGKMLGILNYPPLHGVPTVPLHRNLLIYCWRGSNGGVRPAEWYGKWHNLAFCDWLYGCFYCMPRHYPHSYSDLIRHYVKGGFRGMYAEAYPNWPIDGPKLYALSRVMWDLDTDVTAAVDEYLRLAFGPAARPAGQFFAIAEKVMERRDPPDIYSKWSSSIRGDYAVWRARDIESMEQAVKAMEAAVAGRPDSSDAQRVRLFRQGWEWYAVHMRMAVAAGELDAATVGDDATAESVLRRAEECDALPVLREQLWTEVVEPRKNMLYGTERYRELIASSDPAPLLRDGIQHALAAVDEYWQGSSTAAEMAGKWTQAREAHPGLASHIRVREQLAARGDPANNLVVNPGFEQELTGWHIWVRPGTQMDVHLDTEQAHTGSASGYMGPGTIGCYVQDVKVTEGATFYLSCWARRATGNGVCGLHVWWKTPQSADLKIGQWERRAEDRPGQWQRLELCGTVPPGAGVAEILLLGQDNGEDDACWFDDLMCLVIEHTE